MISVVLLLGLLLPAPSFETKDSAQDNPVFQDLTKNGLLLAGKVTPIAPPSLASNASKEVEQEALKKIVKGNVRLEEFLRPAVDAPVVTKSIYTKIPQGAIWRYDFWFVVYAPLKSIDENQDESQKVGPQVVENGNVKVTTTVLDAPFLATRKIKSEKITGQKEWFVSEKARLFDLVEMEETNHLFGTQDDDSWLVAFRTDPRFDNDEKFPNRWRPLDDTKPAQKFQKFDGVGGYTKVSKLKSVAGALLVESHAIYFEPKGWSDVGSMLDGKIPVIVKTQTRKLRDDVAAKFPLPEAH